MKRSHKISIYLFAVTAFFFVSQNVQAANLGETVTFSVEQKMDASSRSELAAKLVKVSEGLYFYVDQSWWEAQSGVDQEKTLLYFQQLTEEFENRIYPTITSSFGQELRPGVDKDLHIAILFHAMISAEGGYFREADAYEKLQVPISNQREMLYLSINLLQDPYLSKVVLAHEFMHMVTFNQKRKLLGLSEEVWLDEARAEYAAQMLGYNDTYEGSLLEQRVTSFLESPSDSLTEWRGTRHDYAVANLFTQYVVEHYGISILVDSLHAPSVGMTSLNYALKKSDFKEDIAQVFSNWAIATILNDCNIKKEYCYLDPHLKNFRVIPSLNFLPVTGNSSLSVNNFTRNWSGNWLKFIGGNGSLQFDFSSGKDLAFKVYFIPTDSKGEFSVQTLVLDKTGKGEVSLPNFGDDYKSLIVIPLLLSSSYEATYLEPMYPYNYTISIQGKSQDDDQTLIQQLLDRITYLKSEIARLQGTDPSAACTISVDLQVGSRGQAVSCLQTFLKAQGSAIYPEGLVTGTFGSLTRSAVVRFQEKFAADILVPGGLIRGTGYVGMRTRAKINSLMSSR